MTQVKQELVDRLLAAAQATVSSVDNLEGLSDAVNSLRDVVKEIETDGVRQLTEDLRQANGRHQIDAWSKEMEALYQKHTELAIQQDQDEEAAVKAGLLFPFPPHGALAFCQCQTGQEYRRLKVQRVELRERLAGGLVRDLRPEPIVLDEVDNQPTYACETCKDTGYVQEEDGWPMDDDCHDCRGEVE